MRGSSFVKTKVVLPITTLLLSLIAIFFVATRFIGLTPYYVMSGSMEPAIPVGSLVYVRKVLPESVRVGDAITFTVNEGLQIVTHRVAAVDAENKVFITKGDANNTRDGKPVDYSNVLGTSAFIIPYLGYLAAGITKMVRSPWIWTTAAVLGYLVWLKAEGIKDQSEVIGVEPERHNQ